jgi:hypothetical protein
MVTHGRESDRSWLKFVGHRERRIPQRLQLGEEQHMGKICAMSVVLATFAPLILLTLWTKNKVGPRWHRVLRTAGFHLSTQRDQWTRELTLYEILTGEMPRKRRK